MATNGDPPAGRQALDLNLEDFDEAAAAPRQVVRPASFHVDEPPPVWRAPPELADDPTEQQLLAQLRDAPGDPATRLVYADWLEQRGEPGRAALVRHTGWPDALLHGTPAWRAIVAAAPIEDCTEPGCPAGWHAPAVRRRALPATPPHQPHLTGAVSRYCDAPTSLRRSLPRKTNT
jgi:uncharacterized protein (TIGR02996 family)